MNLKTILSWAFARVTCRMCVKLNGALLERKSHVMSYTLDIAVHLGKGVGFITHLAKVLLGIEYEITSSD
ncbi:hypothetical protein GBA52_011966 [Prunus armeniaca]|nr:hypothetical protein GBA52_011966 [Prunus armeniaca]